MQRQLRSRTVRAGEEELFKARARENGEVKIIDLITARLDNRGEYVASLPSLRLTDVRISGELVNQHERMLTGGFYAELAVSFDMAIAQESKGRPFGVESLRPIQLSRRDALDTLRNQSRISPLQNRVYFGGALVRAGHQRGQQDGQRTAEAALSRWRRGCSRSRSGVGGAIPPAFCESMGYAEQNLYARAAQLVGDKDPRQHEFTVQLRAFDASRSGARLGIAALVALCTALLRRSVRGGLILVGEINLGGSIEPIHNAVTLAEIAVEKGATALVMPVACRRQLFDLSDDMATRFDIQFYADAKDALLKAIAE